MAQTNPLNNSSAQAVLAYLQQVLGGKFLVILYLTGDLILNIANHPALTAVGPALAPIPNTGANANHIMTPATGAANVQAPTAVSGGKSLYRPANPSINHPTPLANAPATTLAAPPGKFFSSFPIATIDDESPQAQPQVPVVAGAVYQAPAVLLATLLNPPLADRVIDMNPIFHPVPHPHALALHFHGAPDSQTYYVVARGRRCGIFSSSTVAEGYTRSVSNNMLRARASFSDALEEYSAVWNAGLVHEA
ncbi:hypothetical protein C8J56DRAFT_903079 [Mycena floridula]|nr:hypothetical protein C8J56DRAFT_903079 [Mycena floridula]